MSRAAGGAYTLPAGNPVVTATVISSTWANTTLSDLATAMSDSLSRSGLGNMTVPLLNPDGTAALPAYSFATEPSSGLYRVSAGVIGLSVLNRLGLQQIATGAVNIPSPSSGTAFTITNGLATTVPALITSSQSQAATAPLLQLRSTAANGFANLSICGNSNSPNSSDFSIFQNGADNSASVLNRANASLFLGANSTTWFTIAPAGNLSNTVPTSGTALTINGIASGSEIIKINDGTTAMGFFTAGTAGQFGTTTAHSMQLLSNSIARLQMTSAGVTTIWEGTNNVAAAGLMAAATFETGSFTATLVGCTTSPTASVVWTRVGNMVTLNMPGTLTGTSNTVGLSFTGLTAGLQPARAQRCPAMLEDNTAFVVGTVTLAAASGTVTAARPDAAAFTAAGVKGFTSFTLTYSLA